MKSATATAVSNLLRVADRARDKTVGARFLRRAARILVANLQIPGGSDLSIFLVGDTRMARLNASLIGHEGTTDVITLDYAMDGVLAGEIYICVPEAKRQAKRFRVPARREAMRYAVHGVLHMLGYDDTTPAKRLKMKREENRLVGVVERALRQGS